MCNCNFLLRKDSYHKSMTAARVLTYIFLIFQKNIVPCGGHWFMVTCSNNKSGRCTLTIKYRIFIVDWHAAFKKLFAPFRGRCRQAFAQRLVTEGDSHRFVFQVLEITLEKLPSFVTRKVNCNKIFEYID